ncbi:hypothetical protein LCGC14_0861700 [marine sediment metagenome]|uniref:Uncharacterized protein n=1 Tax=marine sediment metagenome TaxID=412755 RepID=A0A0F9PC42_9ZZZZ
MKHILFAFIWIIIAVLFWEEFMLPMALTQVSEGDQAIVALGVFWGIATVIVSVYLILMGSLPKCGGKDGEG